MRFKLTAKRNENTGEIGWLDSRIRGSDTFEPMSEGMTLAHDMLEHAGFDGVSDEIEAHGGMYFVRYLGGWHDRMRPNGYLDMESFADEWRNLFQGMGSENGYLKTPPKTRSLDSSIENDIDEIIEEGKKILRSEFVSSETLDEHNEDMKRDIERIASVFRAFFRIGYRKAVRRYRGVPSFKLAETFNVLAAAMQRERPEYEGQEIDVFVNVREEKVRIIEKEMAY